MGKFINPKKIKGQDKVDRIKDLMGKMNTLNESTSLSEIENVKKGANGVIYGIVRENHNYFIKTTDKTSGNLIAEDFQYIGGLQNKNLERYDSYAQALKHLNLKFDMLNESFGVKKNNNLFESDAVEVKEANASGVIVKEEEKEVIEDQKKVIKVDAPAPPVEDEVADEEEISMGEDPFADEEGGEDEEVSMDVDVEEEGEDDGDGYTKKIQKLTGKIGQMLRDKDEPDAELDKYVINSIISAIDWEEIPDEDVEDIIAKIEGEDEEDDTLEGGDEESVDIDMDVEEEGGDDPFADEEGGEEELAESDEKEESQIDEEEIDCTELIKMVKRQKIKDFEKKLSDLTIDPTGAIGSVIEKMIRGHKADLATLEEKCKGKKINEDEEKVGEKETISISDSQMKKLKTEGVCECDDKCLVYKDADGVDKHEVLDEIAKIDKKCVFISEKQMKMLEEKGECSCGDVRLKSKKGKVEESRRFSKKQLMENFLKKNINESLNKILKENSEAICEECLGEGCHSCKDGDIEENIDITGDLAAQLGDDVGVVHEEMDVVDAIATGQNYLQATGDLDRDGDQIPNRLDMDSNMDGELDFETFDDGEEFIEIDFDSLMGNSPAPTKEPGIAEPTTRPGKKKPRWKKIPKPNVNPKPKASDSRKFSLGRKGMYR